MRSLSQLRRFIAVVFAFAYPVLAHTASVLDSGVLTLTSVIALAAAMLAPPLLERRRWAYLVLPIVAFVIAELSQLDAIALVLFAPPVFLNAYLAWLFGHTLANGRIPLIERLVRLLQPPGIPFEQGVIDYARRLTGLWTGVFLFFGAANLLLAALATPGGLLETAGIRAAYTIPLEAWSLFANVLNYGIVATLFLAEFAWRRRRFPGRPYRNLADFLRRTAAVAPALARSLGRGRHAPNSESAAEREFTVPADHPAFAGHFPGRPVLPAVVLLDTVLEAARDCFDGQLSVAGLPHAKFTASLVPGDRGTIRLKLTATALEFEVRRGPERVAQGVLRLRVGG